MVGGTFHLQDVLSVGVSHPQHEWHASKMKSFSMDNSSIMSFITHYLPHVTTQIKFCIHKGHREINWLITHVYGDNPCSVVMFQE